VHQVRFAKANATIEEQRIKSDGAPFGHAARCGMGKLVRFAHNKAVKCETLFQRRGIHRRAAGWFGRQGTRRFDGIGLARDGLCLLGNLKAEAIHRCIKRLHLVQDKISEILADVVSKERRGHIHGGDPVLGRAENQRVDPGREIVLSDRFKKPLLNAAPIIPRHALLTAQFIPPKKVVRPKSG